MTRIVLVLLLATAACSGDGDGDADARADDAHYRVFALATALDRIAILRADDATDTCGMIRLVSPADAGGSFGIDTPANWGIDMAGVTQGSANCFDETFAAPEVAGASGSGDIEFTIEAGMFYPTTLSVDATVAFDAGPTWVPTSISFTAADVAVE